MTDQEIQDAMKKGDVQAVFKEINRLCEQLSDCWMVIDSLARCPVDNLGANPQDDFHVRMIKAGMRGLVKAAQSLLQHQQAPGWYPPKRIRRKKNGVEKEDRADGEVQP